MLICGPAVVWRISNILIKLRIILKTFAIFSRYKIKINQSAIELLKSTLVIIIFKTMNEYLDVQSIVMKGYVALALGCKR